MQCTCATLSSVVCLALQYFSVLSHKWHERQKNLLNIKHVLWFFLQLSSETFLILWRIEWDVIKNVYWFRREVPFILVRFYWNLNFLHKFSKITQKHVAFCNFVNMPKETVHSMKKYKDTFIKHVSSSLFTSGTYLLHGAVLLEKLTGSQLVKKFPTFYGAQRLITRFTKAHHLYLP